MGRKPSQKSEDDKVVEGANASIFGEIRSAIWDAAGKFASDKTATEAKDNALLPDELIWKFDKVLTFKDFCASPEHMNFPPLSPRQLRVAEFMFGEEPKKLFHTNRNLACLVWGKGSGKDTVSVLMICYVIYVLLCLKNPQQFLGSANHDSIDLLNVAASKEQAQTVFFQNFKTRVLHWSWLKSQWDIQSSGRFFSSAQKEDAENAANRVTITNDAILFPNNIRAFSGSCEAETLEGKNLLMFVLDEVDAFKTDSQIRSAEKIYRTLRTSAVSRFGTRFKGFVISYPRSSGGFILKMYESTKKFLNIYGDVAKTWEVKPRELFSKQEFEFEGHSIPVDFYEEFRLDPIGAKRAYLCIAPAAETPYMEDVGRVDASIGSQAPLFEFRDEIKGTYVRKKITKSPHLHDRSIEYTMLLDLGIKKDSTALTLMHREHDKIIVDFSTAWTPNPKEGIVVDLENVEEIINSIRDQVTIKDFYADHWNSPLFVQKLRNRGIKAEILKLKFEDYQTFKRLLYAGNISLIRHQRLIHEIKNLQLYSGNNVDHAPDEHNDMAVTIVMGTKVLVTIGKGGMSSNMAAEGEYVGDNMNQQLDAFADHDEFVQEGVIVIDGIPLG